MTAVRESLCPPHRMSVWQRRTVTGPAALLLLSGLGWLCSHWLLHDEGLQAGLPHPSEAWWLRLHGIAVVGGLLALGSLLPWHVTHGLRRPRNRVSGIATLAGCAVLVATGYGLYYLTADDWRAAASSLHWLAGLAMAPALLLHARAVHATARANDTASAGRASLTGRQGRSVGAGVDPAPE